MKYLVLSLIVIATSLSSAQAPKVGRKAAEKYFPPQPEYRESAPAGDNVLMILAGTYVSSASYNWKGSAKRTGVAKSSIGITYLFDRWESMDMNFRAEFNEFELDDVKPLKLTLMPLITFPAAATQFPLYFGIGAGAGIFFTQVEEESDLSFDYQLLAGLRLMDLYEGVGFVAEFSLKNHLHLVSDGQLNGSAVSVGAVFNF